jgi:hypothetical protein
VHRGVNKEHNRQKYCQNESWHTKEWQLPMKCQQKLRLPVEPNPFGQIEGGKHQRQLNMYYYCNI